MKNVMILILLLTVTITGAVACSGNGQEKTTTSTAVKGTTTVKPSSTTPVQVPSDEEFLKMALKSITGQDISEVRMNTSGITISYKQLTDDSQAVLVQRWLDMAAVAASFMEKPQNITIIPVVEGTTIAEITVKAEDLASLVTGKKSLQETLSLIEIKKPG